eukprot:TRINITY_DN2447_c0_g1_i4.p1 TRINITY_DN2447_c0_g1~~TRINITY_DN2447_c0_g1_i4.p1  ORF type:complete len:159 (-),score=35.02 TRINITY_DN2447_c0_g1_i4:289-765(-)
MSNSGSHNDNSKPAFEFRCFDLCVSRMLQLWDGTLVLAGGARIERWTLDGKRLNTFSGHTMSVCALIELDNESFLSCSYDGILARWSTQSTTTNNNKMTIIMTGSRAFTSCIRLYVSRERQEYLDEEDIENAIRAIIAIAEFGGGLLVWDHNQRKVIE